MIGRISRIQGWYENVNQNPTLYILDNGMLAKSLDDNFWDDGNVVLAARSRTTGELIFPRVLNVSCDGRAMTFSTTMEGTFLVNSFVVDYEIGDLVRWDDEYYVS